MTAFHLASADAASVQETLAGLFQSQGTSGASQTTSALSARMQANNNSQSSSATTTTSGFGTGKSGSVGEPLIEFLLIRESNGKQILMTTL